MGIAEFQLLKNNLIESMKIETEKIPELISKKNGIEQKIVNVNTVIDTEKERLKSISESIKSLEEMTPISESEIKNLHKEMEDEEEDYWTNKYFRLPDIEVQHHIYMQIIGSLIVGLFLYSEINEGDLGPDIVLITGVLLAGSYLMAFFYYWALKIYFHILHVFVELLFGTDHFDKHGWPRAKFAGEWPPPFITGRTKNAILKVEQSQEELRSMERKHDEIRNRIKENSKDSVNMYIVEENKKLKSQKNKLSRQKKKLEQFNKDINDIEAEIETLKLKSKNLVEEIAYLIPFSSELS